MEMQTALSAGFSCVCGVCGATLNESDAVTHCNTHSIVILIYHYLFKWIPDDHRSEATQTFISIGIWRFTFLSFIYIIFFSFFLFASLYSSNALVHDVYLFIKCVSFPTRCWKCQMVSNGCFPFTSYFSLTFIKTSGSLE